MEISPVSVGNYQVLKAIKIERGCVVKLARVAHRCTHRKSGEVKGSELGFYSLPTDNALVTTTTFIYKNSTCRELLEHQTKQNSTKRGAA